MPRVQVRKAKHGGPSERLLDMQIESLARVVALRIGLVVLVSLLILVLLPAVVAAQAATV